MIIIVYRLISFSESHQYVGFKGGPCIILGICHVIIGGGSMVVNGIGMYFNAHMHNYAQGMWAGAVVSHYEHSIQ